MYDKKYAEAWITDYESGKDVYRTQFIIPFLEKAISQAPDKAQILDVGCGWGITIPHLRNGDEYIGIDVTTDFFDYVRKIYPDFSGKLQAGGLPDSLGFEENSFDLVISSMSLHTVKELGLSIDNLISRVKSSGKLILVDFNNKAEKPVSERFSGTVRKGYCQGMYTLNCGLEVESEVFFHREEEYERELRRHGELVKTSLGPVFVGYEIVKN